MDTARTRNRNGNYRFSKNTITLEMNSLRVKFRPQILFLARPSLRQVTGRFGVSSFQKRFSSTDEHKEETYEEYNERYLQFFSKEADDSFELSRGLNNAFNTDIIPSPEVIAAALKCARKLNSYSLASRTMEALRDKVEGDDKLYAAYLEELKPTLQELEKNSNTSTKGELERAIDYYRKLDLQNLHATLDSQSMQLVENQKETSARRKKLAEETKSFRKLEDPQKISELPKLLKSYQGEIDGLSKRLKTSEGFYFNLFQLLSEHVDPLAYLEDFLSQQNVRASLQAVELENKKLREEISTHTEEAQKQAELVASNMRLSERIKLLERQLQIAESKSSQQPEIESLNDQISFFRERESDLMHQLQVNEAKLANSLSQNKEGSERGVSGDVEGKNAAELVQRIESLEAELLQTKIRCKHLERELKSFNDDGHAKFSSRIDELGLQLQQSENSRKSWQEKAVSLEGEMRRIEQEHLVERGRMSEKMSQLEQVVEARNDYPQITRELMAFKKIEFGENKDVSSLSSEALAIQKARRLQAQVSDLSMRLQEAETELLGSKSQVEDHLVQLRERNELISKLEADIGALQGKDLDRGTASQLQETSEQSSLLQVVTGQRDRFYAKNIELESQLKDVTKKALDFESDISSLREDNVRMYEKVRFLTAFNQDVQKSTTTQKSRSRYGGDQASGSRDYEAMYEKKIDPFSQFHRDERRRRVGQLAIQDRIAHHLTRLFLSNRYSRLFFVLYTLALHLLIFGVLFHTVDKAPSSASPPSTTAEDQHPSFEVWMRSGPDAGSLIEAGWQMKAAIGATFCSTFCPK